MKSAIFPVIVTALIVVIAAWMILGTNATSMITQSLRYTSSSTPQSKPSPIAEQHDKKPVTKATKAKRTQKSVGAEAEIPGTIVFVDLNKTTATDSDYDFDRPFPHPTDIHLGMNASSVRAKFGNPDLEATGVDRGLIQAYVYHRKADDKQVVLHFKDGVVQSAHN